MGINSVSWSTSIRHDGCSLWRPLQAGVVTRRRWFCCSLFLPSLGCRGGSTRDDMCRKIPMQRSSSHRLLLGCPKVLFGDVTWTRSRQTVELPRRANSRDIGMWEVSAFSSYASICRDIFISWGPRFSPYGGTVNLSRCFYSPSILTLCVNPHHLRQRADSARGPPSFRERLVVLGGRGAGAASVQSDLSDLQQRPDRLPGQRCGATGRTLPAGAANA